MNVEASRRAPIPWVGAVVSLSVACVLLVAGIFALRSQLDSYQQRERALTSEVGDHRNRLELAQDTERTLRQDIESYKGQISDLQKREEHFTAENGRLKQELEQVKASGTSLPIVFNGDELTSKGLRDPVADIKADLMRHNELIPFEGVLGGKMCFCFEDSIYVLNSNWVFAYFEDGHILGTILLEYTVSEQGEISWRVIEAQLNR